MKILVTGGAGFIGSHIVDEYISLRHRVVVIDNLLTGFRKNLNPKAKFYKADIRDLPKIKKIFNKERPQIVNHHAAIAEVVKSLRDPLPTLNVNVIGTVNLLLSAGKIGVKKFIFSSTGGAIYGQPDKIPADENTPAIPLSPYGLSKLLGEESIKFYAKNYGFDYLIFRYPNIYGPRQNPKGEAGVVAIFSGLIKENKQPTIFGDGTKTRDYVYINDIARANIIGLNKGKNEILNLGWAKKISDQKIFDVIAKNLNFKKPPIYAPFRKGEVYQIALLANRAKKILGWQPKIQLKEGIRKTI
jgi:UDP-glucose 4-epimerase